MYLTHKRSLTEVGTFSKMATCLRNIYLVCMVILVHLVFANAGVIHTVRERSIESKQEMENAKKDLFGGLLGGQSIRLHPKVNTFQFLVPFWWHYLRPMLNIFAMDTHFRQTLQKEYEYELEHGSLNEKESFKIETRDAPNVGNIERHEGEITENNLEIELNDAPENSRLDSLSNVMEVENRGPNEENAVNSNLFGLSSAEFETGEHKGNIFSENEATNENVQSEEETTSVEAFRNLDNSFMETEQVNGEIDRGETQNWDGPEHKALPFGLTGDIVSAFSNSLMGLMPSIRDEQELNENIGKTVDEVDTNIFWITQPRDDGTIEPNEANFEIENAAKEMDSNTVSDTVGELGHSVENVWNQGGQLQTNGFEMSEFLSEIPDGHAEETTTLLSGESAIFQAADPDNSDNNDAQSFSDSTFAPPFNFFSPNLESQNEHDSST